MKNNGKSLFIILPFSLGALTTLHSVNMNAILSVISIVLTILISAIIIKSFNIIEKISKLPKFSNSDVFISLIMSWFIVNSVLKFHNYYYTFLMKLIALFADKTGLVYDDVVTVIINIIGLFASVSIFYILLALIRYSFPIIKSFKKTLMKSEKVYLIVTAIIFSLIITIIYHKTTAFSYPKNPKNEYVTHDVLFTTDTGIQIHTNTYLKFSAAENDIRQPLFTLAAYPFAIIADVSSSFVNWLTGNNSNLFYQIFLGWMQAYVLILIGLLIKRLLQTDISVSILYLCSFSTIFFALNLEQYVFGMFWLILWIYNYIKSSKNNYLFSTISIGSLITNSVLLPFFAFKKDLKAWLSNFWQCIGLFFLLIIIFGKLASVYANLVNFNSYVEFMGTKVIFIDKLSQFLYFLASCFIAPTHFTTLNPKGYISLQLVSVETISIIGILIFVISTINLVKNRKNIITRVAYGWFLLSVLLLLIVGWGTIENGLILYGIYFSWAYTILIFQFLQTYLKKDMILKIIIYLISGSLLVYNVCNLSKIISFGIQNYPAIFK